MESTHGLRAASPSCEERGLRRPCQRPTNRARTSDGERLSSMTTTMRVPWRVTAAVKVPKTGVMTLVKKGGRPASARKRALRTGQRRGMRRRARTSSRIAARSRNLSSHPPHLRASYTAAVVADPRCDPSAPPSL